jgi:hypothetical protein
MGLFGSTKQLSLCTLTGPVADLSCGDAKPASMCRRGCAGHTMCVCQLPAAAGFNWQVLRQLPCSLGSMACTAMSDILHRPDAIQDCQLVHTAMCMPHAAGAG